MRLRFRKQPKQIAREADDEAWPPEEAVFISRQNALTCKARYCFTISVHPSVSQSVCLSVSHDVLLCHTNKRIVVKVFPSYRMAIILVLLSPPLLQNSGGRVLKICDLDRNCRLSRKHYEAGLCIT